MKKNTSINARKILTDFFPQLQLNSQILKTYVDYKS